MTSRFNQLGLNVKFWEGHHALDPECAPPLHELEYAQQNHTWDAHAWSVLQGHLMIMRDFLSKSDCDFLCVMEDDVHIRKDFPQEQPIIQAQFNKLKLDVCMLGYLTANILFSGHYMYEPLTPTYAYLQYPHNVYGTQMYVVSRSYAQTIWDSYGATSAWHSQVFTGDLWRPADWIITKQGHRACIYPVMAVEESGGGLAYQHTEQTDWHAMCHEAQYDADKFV